MSLIDSEPEINFDHLNQYVGGDIALTKEIFSLFKNQVDMWSKQLLPEANDEIWAAVTHSLKGSARAVGAMRLAQTCEDAESLIGDNNRIEVRKISVDTLGYRINRTQAEINRWEYNQKMKEIRG